MRSDVKVGVICLFVLLLAVVGYFAWSPKGDRAREVPRGAQAGLTSDPDKPGSSGGLLNGPNGPAADGGPHVTIPPASAAAPTDGTYVSGGSVNGGAAGTQPGSYRELSGTPAHSTDIAGALPGSTTGAATRPAGLTGGLPTGRPDMPPPATATAPAATEYFVKRGDSMWSIAHANHITRAALAAANGISPDAQLKEKQKLKLPAAVAGDVMIATRPASRPTSRPATASAGTQPSATAVKVKAGDSLRKIARAVYGDESKWRKLYNANKAAIGDDPNGLTVGTTLKVPQ